MRRPLSFVLTLALSACAGVMAAEAGGEPTPRDLLAAATTRPWPGENYPVLPSLSTAMRGRVGNEIARAEVRRAFELLDAGRKRNVDWFEAVKLLEAEEAVWSLQACLVHPSEDVQIHALRALARLKDREAVPFLLTYGDYMAVTESGSENATLHGIIHQETAHALSAVTGVEVRLNGRSQDADGLRHGLDVWAKWLVEQRKPAAP